jgi:hypothetical protein
MGHPGLLMILAVIVPLLLLSPIAILELEQIGVLWQSAAGLLAVVLTWSLVRSLAQRFELEADIASVQALGAGPCSRALMAVAHMAIPVPHSLTRRLFSLHPDEPARCETMRRYELDPAFRARFDAIGRRLRVGILAMLGVAALTAAFAWSVEWPYERVIWRLETGDVAGARRLVAEVGEVPERWRETWTHLTTEVAAAAEIAPDATSWAEAQPVFVEQGWKRGTATLLRSGPAAACPWFALAASAGGGGDRVLRQAVYEFCRAARDTELARMDEVRTALRRHGVPDELLPVFGSSDPATGR